MTSLEIVNGTAALEYWRQFDLTGKRASLDASVEEMRAAKAASISGRKRLNEITKSFRAKSKDEQAETATEILKAYQEEIDQLSRRSKLSELSFYNLYKGIYEAPDPATAINGLINTVSSGSTNALEMEKLKSELAQYDEEFQKLKNQDVTIRRLEEELGAFKNSAEDKVEDIVAERLSEAQGLMEEKIAEAVESQRATERRLQAANEATQLAQRAVERAQTELFDVNSQTESRISALISENSILAEANERSTARTAELEAEMSQLKRAMTEAHEGAGGDQDHDDVEGGRTAVFSASKMHSDLADRAALQSRINDLHAELRNAEETGRVSKAFLERSANQLQEQLHKEREALQETRRELSERPSKEEFASLRRQLRTLQKVTFNVQNDDNSEDEGGDALEETVAGQAEIDAMVLKRIKTLETELLDAKNRLSEMDKAEAAARAQAASTKTRLVSAEALVAKLEGDLALSSGAAGTADNDDTAASASNVRDGTSSVGGAMGANNSQSKMTGELELSELLGVDAGSIPTVKTKPGGALANARQAAESSGQMVSILQGQRDRYKERLATVEAAQATLQAKLGSAQARAKQMEEDNLTLYGKIRYLQSLAGTTGGMPSHISPQPMRISHTRGGGKAAAEAETDSYTTWGRLGLGEGGGGEEDVESGALGRRSHGASTTDTEGPEERYRRLYEAKLNPFAQFSHTERRGTIEDLSVGDHLIYSTLQQFTATPTRRKAMLAYFGTMHLLVLMCFYWMTHHAAHIHGCDPGIDHLTHKTLMLQKLES